MNYNLEIEKFSQKFAFRDALFRSISVIGATFTISAISLLPGFGIKGLVIASAIQLILSSLLELPTSILADKIGRSVILKISLFLKILVSIALGFAIYFASQKMSNFVWYAFFAEAFLDAIASTLMSGSYQISYLSLYSEITSPHEKPPLFLHTYKYSIKFRYLFPIAFVFTVIAMFTLADTFQSNLYICAYSILSIIILFRIWLFSLVFFDFRGLQNFNDKTSLNVLEGIHQILNSIKTQKNIFLVYCITCLFNYIGIFYLSGQTMKTLSHFSFSHNQLWIYAIVSCIIVYLVRTTINILLLPKITKKLLLYIQPLMAAVVVFFGAVIFCAGTYIVEPIYVYVILFLTNIVTYCVSDALSKTIESSINQISKTGFKATWISLGNTVAYFVFGLISVLLSLISIELSNFIIGILLICSGILIFFSSIFIDHKNNSLPSFSEVLRKQITKGVVFVIGVIFAIDIFSSLAITQSRISEAKNKVSSTIIVGIKPQVLQANLIEINSFLYSLKSSELIKCYDLQIFEKKVNNCEASEYEISNLNKESINISYDSVDYGNVTYLIDVSVYSKYLLFRFLFDIAVSFLLFIIFYKILLKISNSLNAEVQILSGALGEKNILNPSFKIKEFQLIHSQLSTAIELREKLNSQLLHSNISKQVAHDIRSPLSALNMALYGLTSVPEERRILIRNAVQRINDIANDLLEKSKSTVRTTHSNSSILVYQLSPVIDALISEKRIQFRDKPHVDISLNLEKSYGLFAKINANNFKRVLSNIINNSVEAAKSNNKINICVSIFSENNNIIVEISDNGKGIPQSILSKLGTQEISLGKDAPGSGNGLGILHAKKTIESFDGVFNIESSLELGTNIRIILPIADTPDWFVKNLILEAGSNFITFDDDISIHQIWSGRLFAANAIESHIVHHSFNSPTIFKEKALSLLKKKSIFLVDYEILSEKQNGLDFIEQIAEQDKSILNCTILVTSRYEEGHIRERCQRLGIKMIPKTMAAYVPIQIVDFMQSLDAILLDDDSLVHECWKLYAIENNKKIKLFKNVDDFLLFITTVDHSTKIFVDSNLGHQSSIAKGEDVLFKISQMGYDNLYLCTGYDSENFSKYKYIKGVVGKDPLF